MVLTGTFTVVNVIIGGLFAVCASVFATAGWTAPACLAAGAASGIGLIIGIVKDSIEGSTKTSGNDPDPRKHRRDVTTYYKLHPDGHYEDFSDRLHELYGTNETHTMVDFDRGYTHSVRMVNDYVQVKTDLTDGSSTATSGHKRGTLRKRLTAKEEKYQLNMATYMAQKTDTITTNPTKDDENSLGRAIANQAYELGTWCMSIHDGPHVIADIGLTLGGLGYDPDDDEPPCISS